ncbi:MAG: hypothetical protein JRJ62_15935 [Deltaproteobacteria bacterium]|nr:hypothetical protein [Deltaproteobacteria bacterium]
MAIFEEIKKLKDGQCFIWPESDYGKAEVWFKNGLYFLFEIPQYGGMPIYYNCYAQISDLINQVETWT